MCVGFCVSLGTICNERGLIAGCALYGVPREQTRPLLVGNMKRWATIDCSFLTLDMCRIVRAHRTNYCASGVLNRPQNVCFVLGFLLGTQERLSGWKLGPCLSSPSLARYVADAGMWVMLCQLEVKMQKCQRGQLLCVTRVQNADIFVQSRDP